MYFRAEEEEKITKKWELVLVIIGEIGEINVGVNNNDWEFMAGQDH